MSYTVFKNHLEKRRIKKENALKTGFDIWRHVVYNIMYNFSYEVSLCKTGDEAGEHCNT